ncbi:MAG: hypothetical protein WB767_02860 [Nocardioides sp.]
MGPTSSHDSRPGSDENLLAFYELVPVAEEEDLVAEHRAETLRAFADSRVALSPNDEVLADDDQDVDDDAADADDVDPLTPLQQLGMLEHVLGAEEIEDPPISGPQI